MHEELEAALRELEAKLPDLRHLIAESGVVLTTSPAALVLAARLLRAISAADEVASLLRLTLLNGGELVAPMEQPAQPVPLPTPTPPAPSPLETPAINPAEIVATGSGLTDSDYALREALGLTPNTSTFFEEAITELEGTADESNVRQTTQKANRPQFLEVLATMAARQELEVQLKGLRDQINAALDDEDLERVRQLTVERKEVERRLAYLAPLPPEQGTSLRGLTERLNLKTDPSSSGAVPHEDLQTAFRLWGHKSLNTFDEIREEYGTPLEAAMLSYLRNESEAKTVTYAALSHGERVWAVAEGEVSFLELLASLSVQQIEFLVPRPEGEEERYIPNPKEVFRYLARHRVERLIEDIEQRLDRLRLHLQEPETEYPASAYQEIETLERLHNEMLRQFYNSLLRLSDEDDDNGESDAMGARITPPPPMRDPGAERTLDEALAPARA